MTALPPSRNQREYAAMELERAAKAMCTKFREWSTLHHDWVAEVYSDAAALLRRRAARLRKGKR